MKTLVKQANGTLLITNSRRTPERAFQALLSEISSIPLFVHDTKTEESNPYFDYLAFADYFIVTGDSSSMLSDALTTGKPVYVYAPSSIVEQRHRRFIVDMHNSGRVRPLGDHLEEWSYAPLDVANEIREAIEERRDGCAKFLESAHL